MIYYSIMNLYPKQQKAHFMIAIIKYLIPKRKKSLKEFDRHLQEFLKIFYLFIFNLFTAN